MGERLEEIKLLWEHNDYCFPEEYDWLIKQAEMTEEFAVKAENLEKEKVILKNKIRKLQKGGKP